MKYTSRFEELPIGIHDKPQLSKVCIFLLASCFLRGVYGVVKVWEIQPIEQFLPLGMTCDDLDRLKLPVQRLNI